MDRLKLFANICDGIFVLIRFLGQDESVPHKAFYKLGDLAHNWPVLLLNPEQIDFDWAISDLRECATQDLGDSWASDVKPFLERSAMLLAEAAVEGNGAPTSTA